MRGEKGCSGEGAKNRAHLHTVFPDGSVMGLKSADYESDRPSSAFHRASLDGRLEGVACLFDFRVDLFLKRFASPFCGANSRP
jgi:hypothetical protein